MPGDARRSDAGSGQEQLDDLVRDNLGLVYTMARRLQRAGGGPGPERSDLVSAGVIGLIQAAHAFEPERGLAFSTIAMTRIRGAMLDEMRRWDEAPRSLRRKERLIRTSEAELRSELERDPSVVELAGRLGITPDELQGWCDDVERVATESLDAAIPGQDPGGLRVRDRVADDGAKDVEADLTREESLAVLREKLSELPERERTVLALYYLEGLRLREIAEVFEVTESRISQIRKGALRTLRSMLTLAGVEEP